MYLLVEPIETEYEPNILGAIQSERMTAELMTAIEDLSEVEKRILYWRYWEDLPWSEIRFRITPSLQASGYEVTQTLNTLRRSITASLRNRSLERVRQSAIADARRASSLRWWRRE